MTNFNLPSCQSLRWIFKRVVRYAFIKDCVFLKKRQRDIQMRISLFYEIQIKKGTDKSVPFVIVVLL